MAFTTGAMTVAQLDKLIRGWAKSGATVIDTNMQSANPLENAFPSEACDIQRLEFFTTHGNPGVMNLESISGTVDNTKWSYKQISADLKYAKYAWAVTDDAQSEIAVDRMAADGNAAALKYFGAVRLYNIITALKAGNNASCTAGAGNYWNVAAGDAEGDIMAAVEAIIRYSGIDISANTLGVLFPSKVYRGLKQLDLIHNVTQRLEEYLKGMFGGAGGAGINFYPYTPYMNANGSQYIDSKEETSSDALGTSALVFIEGSQTLRAGKYAPPGIPMYETWRVPDVGWNTVMKDCHGCKVVPMYDTSYSTTPLIYEITSVSA